MQQLSFLPGEMTPGERSLIQRALKTLDRHLHEPGVAFTSTRAAREWLILNMAGLEREEFRVLYRAMNHPVIGVVTKADLASMEQISLVKSWLREAGAHNVLVTSAVNNNGVTELFALLHTEEGCC